MSKIVRTMKVNRTLGLLALLLLLSLTLAACGGGGGDSSSSTQQSGTTPAASAPRADKTSEVDGVVVKMSNYSYVPKEIRVKVGESVTFVNEDHLAHDVVQTTPDKVLFGDDRGFESPQIMPGSRWTMTFEDAGRYPILCTVEAHYLLGMTGEIIVEE